MSAYDGEIRIKASIDADRIDKELQKLSSKIERQSEALNRQSLAAEKLKQKYQELANGTKQTAEELGILKQLKELDKQIDILENKIQGKSFELLPDITKCGITKEFDELTEKSIKLREQLEKIKLDPKSTESMKQLAKEIENGSTKTQRLNSELRQTENEFIKLSNQKTNDFTAKIDEARNAVYKMGNDTQKTGKKSQGIFQSMGEAVSGFGIRIMRLAGAAFVFKIISAGFKKIREHMGNLIAQDNQLISSLNQVRANLLTAFMPIWQAILPALQALGKALTWVTSHIAAFVSMLFGKSIQQSQTAAKSYINTTNALKKQAKGYEKVGKAAKKASGELASFDKIEVLRQKDKMPKNSGNSGGAEVPKILGGFKDIDVSIIDRVREVFERLKKPFENWNLEPLREQFERLLEILKRFGGKIGEGLWWFYENVLAPLAKWTIGEVLPQFLNILNNSLEAIEPILDKISEDLKYLWDVFLKPVSEWTGSKITEFLDLLSDSIKKLGDTIKINKIFLEFLSAFLIGLGAVGVAAGLGALVKALGAVTMATWKWTFALLANPITWIIAGIASLIAIIILIAKHWDEMEQYFSDAWKSFKNTVQKISDIFEGFIQHLSGWIDFLGGLFTGNWQRMWNGAGNIVQGAANVIIATLNAISGAVNTVINFVIGGLNFLIDKLNGVGFTMPEWLGGHSFNFNISKIPQGKVNIPEIPKLPRLAQGAVLEGGNPFLAWVNDQPRGQMNVETPLNTMVQAFKKAINDMPQNNRPIILESSGDFAGFIRFLNLKLKQEDARVGQSFAALDSWI